MLSTSFLRLFYVIGTMKYTNLYILYIFCISIQGYFSIVKAGTTGEAIVPRWASTEKTKADGAA